MDFLKKGVYTVIYEYVTVDDRTNTVSVSTATCIYTIQYIYLYLKL